MAFESNSVIDYFGNNDICLGLVKKFDTMRATVENVTGVTGHVTEKQVIASYPANGKTTLAALSEVQNKILMTMEEIDLDLLWDDINKEPVKYSIKKITEKYFSSSEPLQMSAMARKLTADTLRFQRQGQEFLVRTPEQVEQQRQLLQQRAERAALKERRAAWLAKVIAAPADGAPIEVPEEMEEFVRLCRDYLMLGFNSDAVNLLSAVRNKSSIREIALSLLKKTNRLPADADEFLLVNGIHAGFAPNVVEYAEQLASNSPDLNSNTDREDMTNLPIFSIDDEWTREIDDALSIVPEGDGGWCVGIHLSNPSEFVKKNDLLDEVAIDRPLSLYLPTTTVTMFPEALGCNLASLSAEEIRPAFSFILHFNQDLELCDWNIRPSKIKVTHRLTYIQTDDLLSGKSDDAPAAELRQLNRIAKYLAKCRDEDGAIRLNRPSWKILVKGDDIQIFPEDQESESHCLVQEFMIMANHLAAKFALHNDIPIIYRCQDGCDESIHSVIHYNPIDFDLQVRKMKKTRLSTYPQMHFGLGLDVYTQISSPLRRYADLVIQRQITAFINNQPIPYTQEELFAVLDNAERTSAQNRALEREARKYWLLEYLRRNCQDEILSATIVRLDGNLVLAELNEYYERGVVMTRERLKIGQQVKVRIAEIHPKLSRLSLDLID